MAWKLFYYEVVSLDIKEAKRWYREQQKGLDKRFAEDIKISIKRLQKNPQHYEIKYKNIRVSYSDIFPYSIHFYIDELSNRLVIIAILHQHRNPDYSAKR